MPPIKRPRSVFVALAAIVAVVVVLVFVFLRDPGDRRPIRLDLDSDPGARDAAREPAPRPVASGSQKTLAPRKAVDAPEAGVGEGIAGLVLNESASPVEGAVCELFENSSPLREQCQEGESRDKAVTTTDGFFACDRNAVSPTGRYLLKITHPMYATGMRPIDLGRECGTIRVTLHGGTPVSGAITAIDGKALPNATVTLWDANQPASDPNGSLEATTVADAAGLYTLPHVTAGMKNVRVALTGYATAARAALRVEEGKPLTKVDFVLSEGGTITGRVVAQGSGAPVAVGWVSARAAGAPGLVLAVHPQADGAYVIGGVESRKTYVVGVNAPGFMPPLQLTVTAPAQNADFVLAPSACIVGRVVDDETGKPVALFTVGLSSSPDEVVLSGVSRRSFGPPRFADGRFEYLDVPPGRFWLLAEARGFAGGRSSEIVIAAGDRREGVEIRLIHGATVKGRVVDSKGAPIPDATVEADQARDTSDPGKGFLEFFTKAMRRDLRETKTGRDGSFALTNLLPGTYVLNVRHPEFGPATTPPIVVPATGEKASPDIVLARGAIVRGRVRLPDGSPDPKALVQVIQSGSTFLGMQASSPTDSEGRFELTGLAIGQYRVVVAQRNGQPDIGPMLTQLAKPNLITVGEGEVKELDL